MEQHVKVEIVPRTVPADEDTKARRAEMVDRLAGLNLIDSPESGEVSPTATAWSARINGAEFPIDGCAMELAEDGRAVVSLMVAADQVSVGRSPSSDPQPPGEPEAQRRVWGDPSIPDPRSSMPGWAPGSVPSARSGSVSADRSVAGRMHNLGLMSPRDDDGLAGVPA